MNTKKIMSSVFVNMKDFCLHRMSCLHLSALVKCLCIASSIFLLFSNPASAQGLEVNQGDNNTSQQTGGYIWCGDPMGQYLSFDRDGIQSRFDFGLNTLRLNEFGGNITLLGSGNTGNIFIDGFGLYYENLTDRIGIGTSDPTHKLTVNGRTQSLGLDLDGEDYFNNGAGVDDGVIRSISEGSADLIFISNDNIRFDLDENGGDAGEFEIFNTQNVKVLNIEETGGMTVKGAKMRLTNETESKSIEFRTTGGAVDIDALNADLFLTADGGNDIVLQAITGSVGIGTTSPSYLLHVDGTAGKPGGGSWSNSSDLRLKTDIKSFDLGLQALDAVNPVLYHYNGKDNLPTDKEYVGVIAQELQKIAPFMVSEYVGSDNETYLAVDPSAFDFILINAIKELQAEIELLKREREDKYKTPIVVNKK